MGIVSLFADMVYEGARSILGPFLVTLGASSAAVGLVSGLGEFAGYGLRVVAGYAADRTQRYWALTIAGYGLTVVSVPLLGFVGRVDLALALVVGERLGKAIRTPSRDTLLSHASHSIGRGWGFGLHEALDQTGAVIGPLLLAGVLALRQGDYRLAFLSLAIPGALAMGALAWARMRLPDARALEISNKADDDAGDGATSAANRLVYRRYLMFTFLAVLGFAPFPLIAYHLVIEHVVGQATIPLMFAFAMGVDALVALVCGRAYDRRGLMTLVGVPFATALVLLAFTHTAPLAWAGAGVWGAVMGLQESTLRAAVGDLIAAPRRATAYGIFNGLYGLGFLVGATALGALYGQSIASVVLFVVAAEVLAVAAFARLAGALRTQSATP
jgi:MFS family permease